MQSASDLPSPPANELAHSERLVAHIRERIVSAGGWLGFADYMDLALNAPGLGYYSAGTGKFGAAGDFVTAPELGSLFAATLARCCSRTLDALDGGVILEIGAGSGSLAADLLEALGPEPPERYLILETSADLRDRQRQLLASRVPQLMDRIEWLQRLPAPPLTGVLLANEVLDALPVERLTIRGGTPWSIGVTVEGAGFVDAPRPAPPALAAAIADVERDIGHPLAESYTSEICLRLPDWVAAMGGLVGSGLALFVDYGGARREYYHQDRRTGTLACHYRHRFHTDPFLWPGLQDITAWVDFSAVANAARRAGLRLAGYGTQAHFLLAGGLLDELARSAGDDPRRAARFAAEARRLLLPGEMGERFKVMALAAGDYVAPDDLLVRDLGAML